MSDRPGCDAHATGFDTALTDELRGLVELLGHRVQPWLDRMAQPAEPGAPGAQPATCAWCPVCATIAVLRGDRPEVAARLAEHTTGLLAAARDLLGQPPAPAPESTGEQAAPEPEPAPRTRAERIEVRSARIVDEPA